MSMCILNSPTFCAASLWQRLDELPLSPPPYELLWRSMARTNKRLTNNEIDTHTLFQAPSPSSIAAHICPIGKWCGVRTSEIASTRMVPSE